MLSTKTKSLTSWSAGFLYKNRTSTKIQMRNFNDSISGQMNLPSLFLRVPVCCGGPPTNLMDRIRFRVRDTLKKSTGKFAGTFLKNTSIAANCCSDPIPSPQLIKNETKTGKFVRTFLKNTHLNCRCWSCCGRPHHRCGYRSTPRRPAETAPHPSCCYKRLAAVVLLFRRRCCCY